MPIFEAKEPERATVRVGGVEYEVRLDEAAFEKLVRFRPGGEVGAAQVSEFVRALVPDLPTDLSFMVTLSLSTQLAAWVRDAIGATELPFVIPGSPDVHSE